MTHLPPCDRLPSRMECLSATEPCEQNGGGRISADPAECEDEKQDWWDCLFEAEREIDRAMMDRDTAARHIARVKVWVERAEKELTETV